MKSTKYAETQTEKNLEAAFAGESQARNKYTYFSSVAKKEGYEQISSILISENPFPMTPKRTVKRYLVEKAFAERPSDFK